MEEIKQLVYNYAKAIHTQNEKDFKALWSSKENTLINGKTANRVTTLAAIKILG